MDIRGHPKALILICALIYVTAGTEQEESLKTPTVIKDRNPEGAKDANYKLSFADYDATWKSFKLEYNKTYTSANEEHYRFSLFMENVKNVEAHNMKYHKGEQPFWMDISRFSDSAQKEFSGCMSSPGRESTSKRQAETMNDRDATFVGVLANNAPNEIDWRKHGYVTPVKDQEDCGSCYAFSVTAAVEALVKKNTEELINLSEQQIVDCSRPFGNIGCHNGSMPNSFRYIMAAGGLESEDTYPYIAREQSCNFDRFRVVASIRGYTQIPQNEEALKLFVASHGPVSAAMYASDNFENYKGGVFVDPACIGDFEPNHGVVVVGYGSSGGKDYWIIKNCRGNDWGMHGYMHLARNIGGTGIGTGMCGIATEAYIPYI